MISIVVVNWNSGDQVRECINSVIQYGTPLVERIVVVDCGSTDGSEVGIEGLPLVTLVRAGANLGFARACNVGAARSTGEFLLFLNPDARLHSDTLSKVIDYMQKPGSAQVAICGIRLIDGRGDISASASRFPTLRILAGKSLGLAGVLPKVFPAQVMSPTELCEDCAVDQVIGAFFFIRRCVFELCGGFDERFFVYFEEVDLSLRVRQRGYSSYFLSGVSAFHKGGGCSEAVKAKRLFYSLRSRILYVFKHFNPVSAVLVLLTSLVLEPISRSVLALSRGSWTSLRETWAAYGMLVRWLPTWIFKGVTR